MTTTTDITNYSARIETIHNILVPHPAMANIRTDLENTIKTHQTMINSSDSNDRSAFSRSNNICLFGDSGTGKTTLCTSIVKSFPNHTVIENGLDINVVPTFYTSVPSPITIKGCALNMLKGLGVSPGKGAAQTLTDELLALLHVAKTNLIILDEFHHLLNNKNSDAVGNWIKNLINTVKIPVLLVGTPGFESLINADPQIASRFPTRHHLSNFSYNPLLKGDLAMKSFIQSLANTYKTKAGLDSMPIFQSPQSLMAIYLATGGSPDGIATLFKFAAKAAIISGDNGVSMQHFKQVYPSLYLAHGQAPKGYNPFDVSIQSLCRIQASVKAA